MNDSLANGRMPPLAGRVVAFAILLTACSNEVPRPDSTAPPVTSSAAATTTPCDEPLFDGSGVGGIRIGMTADSLRQLCRVVYDTTTRRAERQPAHVLQVATSSDTIEAEADAGRIWRIQIASPRLRTADSLGVGTPIGRLLDIPGIRGMTGEGSLYLVSPAHCGVSFRVTRPKDQLRGDWTLAQLRQLPATSVVTSVIILGCK